MKYFARAIVVLFALIGLSKAEQLYIVTNEATGCFSGKTETIYECDMKLVGRQRLLNGTVSIKEDLDSLHHKFQLEFFHSPLGDDQFKRLPMGIPRIGFCEGVKTYYAEMLQPSFQQEINTDFPLVPEEGLCPIPKGEYYMKNIAYNTDSWSKELPRGLLKVVFTLFKDDENAGGNESIIRVEDRK